jgi:hypothetical protein
MALRSETPFRTAQEADALKQRGIFFENHRRNRHQRTLALTSGSEIDPIEFRAVKNERGKLSREEAAELRTLIHRLLRRANIWQAPIMPGAVA